jgi:hypothetical protein
MTMTKIVTTDRPVHRTTDGQEFDLSHKAEAHQAELDIRQMLADNDYTGRDQDLIMQAFHRVGIYVPKALWDDLMK